jgi:hypothetical protein
MSDFDLISVTATEPSFGIHVGQQVLRTHAEGTCRGEHCCIHKPSDHPLNTAQLHWRADRQMMERICEHGVGHPDPDDLEYKRSIMSRQAYRARAYETHGCDGCCGG